VRRREVVFTQRSRDQLRAAKTWWIHNERSVGILADEIEQAVDFLALLPGAGTPYPQAKIAGLRRLYLRRVSSHLYYTFNRDTVTIRAFWHAKRGHGPFFHG
jgi:plasmid stabilization system protein ParE